LPDGVIHQFIPLDSPIFVKRFLTHWKPDLALWVESELWPNLLQQAHQRGTRLWLINARMSQRSTQRWLRALPTAQYILRLFEKIFAGSQPDAERLQSLLGAPVACIGNLKYDTPALPVQAEQLQQLQEQLMGRAVWLAASTHPGEEVMAAETHRRIAQKHANLLTVIVPRHPARGPAIAEMLQRGGWQVSLRSQWDAITEYTQIYIADTLGELGLFYRACPIVFIGGSLVPHGGQNPLEPARLGGAILAGLYMHNFSEICHTLESAGGLSRVLGVEDLSQAIQTLIENPAQSVARGQAAKAAVEAKGGALQQLLEELRMATQRTQADKKADA
jgi:3-deoxy-D-manno-octulosonic-acid transferase